MAVFPTTAKILHAGYEESFDPAVVRTEMDRGVPKQRLLNTKVMQELNCTLLFDSAADAASFETWYFTAIGRIGWFDFTHPRTGATVSARFKDGRLGALAPRNPQQTRFTRDVVVEYLR